MKPPTTTIIILAGGLSRRMGSENKLLMPFPGTTVVGQVLQTATSAGAGAVLLVTGHEDDRIRSAAAAHGNVQIVHNQEYRKGMGSSIRVGVAAADPAASLLIWPGDMPWVRSGTVRKLLSHVSPHSRSNVLVRPSYLGRAGHPVLFGAAYRAELLATDSARGALPVVQRNRSRLLLMTVDDPGVIQDIDTPEDLPHA